jgi:hypothetical protein
MAQVTLPSPWPGYGDSTATVVTDQMAQGVPAGDGSAALNEITQVQRGLVWYNPSVAPLLRITSKVKNSKSVENARFYHLEKQRLPRTATLDATTPVEAGDATTPTQLKVDSTQAIRVNDLLYNSTTGDISRVTAIVDADSISVTANIGDAAPSGTLYAASQVLVNIGNVYEDGSGSGTPFHVVEDEKLYYTQIFKDSIEQTDRYQKTALYEGDSWTNARRQLEQEHLLSIEYAAFFGKASISADATGKLTSTMAGLNSLVTTNRVDFTGADAPTKATFDDIMVGVMQEGHSGYENKELATKTGFFSQRWLAALNSFSDNAIRVIEPSEKTYGLRIMQYQGSWGVLNVLNAPVLNRPEFAGFGFIVDLEHVRQANFKGRDTKFEDNIQLPDVDGKKAQYLSDKSFCVEIDPAHTVLENLA